MSILLQTEVKNAEAMKKPQNVQDSNSSARRTSADNEQWPIRQRSLTAGEQFRSSNELKAQVAQKEQEIQHLKMDQVENIYMYKIYAVHTCLHVVICRHACMTSMSEVYYVGLHEDFSCMHMQHYIRLL